MSVPHHRKLGYDHAIEMRRIEANLRASGLDGIELHFAAIRYYEQVHAQDPTYRERQAAWLAAQGNPRPDLLRQALEQIRDGHNDPRGLAAIVLEATSGA